MKKYGTLIALAVAVVFGIAAVLLANQWLNKRTIEEKVVIQEQMPLSKIVIAGRDLEMGTLLSKENLSLADWPKANVPRGAFGTIEEVEGRVVVSKVTAGIPLVSAEMAAPGSGVGLVATIAPGMRAMSIRVDEVIGVSGFILPNTFVDILHVFGKPQQVKTILERIEVLAIAQQTFVEEGKATVVRTVTLELDPKQAEQLALKTHTGAIHLILRNPAEDELEPPKPEPEPAKLVKVKKLYKPRPQPVHDPTYDITVIRGTKSVETVKLKESVN